MEGSSDQEREIITLIFEKENKENLGNCKQVSLTSVTRNITQQILLETLLRHMGNRKLTGDIQSGFTKTKM